MTQITNDILHVEAKTVPLGADVWANDGTGWHGLRGRAKSAESFIKNGHTETVIHCDFEAPASAEMWERLKENFTAAYGRKTPVNEIPLKDVHIGTGCLEPIAAALPEPEGEICVLIAYSLLGGYIEPLAVSARKDYLLRKIDEHLASMAENMDAALQLNTWKTKSWSRMYMY